MPPDIFSFDPIFFVATKYSPEYNPVPIKSLTPKAIEGKIFFSLLSK